MKLHTVHRLALSLYSGLWWLARPLLARHKRLRASLAKRLVPNDWATPADIWLQAASGGEAYLAWELLKAFPIAEKTQQKTVHPENIHSGTRILVTTWTDQGLEVLNNMRAHLAYERPDLHIQTAYFPFDEIPLMQRALRMVQPKLLALLETELWPSLLYACALYDIPVCLLNGRISPKSLRNYRLLDTFTGKLWQSLAPKAIIAMSPADGDRFSSLFCQNADKNAGQNVTQNVAELCVQIAPNIKFDRAQAATITSKSSSSSQQTPLSPLLPDSPIILLASVREEEETALIPIIRALYEEYPHALIIVAPRHMHRVAAWQALCGDCPKLVLRSSLSPENPAQQGSVIIWDNFGELHYLYAHSHAVFVGGSLAKLGGQNILEPLAAGIIPCTGPHLNNFLWALDLESAQSLPDAGLLTLCHDAEGVHTALKNALEKNLDHTQAKAPESERHAVQQRFATWLTPRLGGTQVNAQLLHSLLQTSVNTSAIAARPQ